MRFALVSALGTSVALATPSLAETPIMRDRTIRHAGVEIATQPFGDPAHPPVLLVMGVLASMLWWPDGLVEDLAASGRYVIRYDNRDTGLSTTYPPGEATYTLADMAGDAVAVMDGYNLQFARLVGMSLGGMIAQRAAIAHPDRVETLTLIASTPLGVGDLPGWTEEYGWHAATGEAVDWSDSASIADFLVRDARMLASTRHAHEAHAARDLIKRDLARSPSFASVTNHFTLGSGPGPDVVASSLRVPTLVIHGTSDPIFPVAHGEAAASVIEGATLLRVEGGGHELHEADWPQVVEVIVGHTGRR